MNKKQLIITFLLISGVVVFGGCAKKAVKQAPIVNEPEVENNMPDVAPPEPEMPPGDEVADDLKVDNEILSLDIDDLDLTLNFKKPICEDINISNKELKDVYINQCKEIYEKGIIDKKYLEFVVEKSNDKGYYNSDLDLLKYFHKGMDDFLEKTVKEYDDYIDKIEKGQIDEYRVSVYLNDKLGKEEVIRFYLTENTKNISDENLKFWNYCEAGCAMYPKVVLEKYIIWIKNLNPASGAGDRCWRAGMNERGTYEMYKDEEQVKCVISTSLFNEFIIDKENISETTISNIDISD